MTAWHEKGFIGFVISAEIYMVTTIILCRWRQNLDNSTVVSIFICLFAFCLTVLSVNWYVSSSGNASTALQGSHSFTDKKSRTFQDPREKFSRTFLEPTNA